MEIVSSSISPLSYNLTVTSVLLTTSDFINSFDLAFRTFGVAAGCFSFSLNTGMSVFANESVFLVTGGITFGVVFSAGFVLTVVFCVVLLFVVVFALLFTLGAVVT